MGVLLDRVERHLARWSDRGEAFFTRFRNPLHTENYYGYRRVEEVNDPQDVHKHQVVYVIPAAEIIFALFLFLYVLFEGVTAALGVVAVVCVLLAGHGGYAWLRERNDVFVLTVERVFRVSGVIAQQKATAPVARLLDITVDKPLMGRILGYGHLILETAAQEQGLRVLRYVPNPDEVNAWIDNVRAGLTPLGNPRRPYP